MERLSVSLLGSFVVQLNGQPVSGFKSDKVRALLAYLAVDSDRPHRRESLAGLLWPDFADRAAFNNLRDALANLRTVIHDRTNAPPFLLISSDTIQFNTESNISLDVRALETLALAGRNGGSIDTAQPPDDLWRGQFLEGFSVRDAAPFEEWVVVTRDRLSRQMWTVLSNLGTSFEKRGDYARAAAYVRQQLQLDPLQEESHQQLMRLLALDGQRSAALAQYELCRRLLLDELGVQPERRTTEIYESIRAGKLQPASKRMDEGTPAAAPKSAPAETVVSALVPPVVARDPELAQLDKMLDLALAGRGQVAFVTGETGAGKTAVLDEFVRRAMQKHGTILAAAGRCNAYTGAGDPYLPFAEIMQMLTGDIEARRAAGNVTPDHARRLWGAFPAVLEGLVDYAPDCIDLLVPGETLLTRARAFAPGGAPWLEHLEGLVQRRGAQTQAADLHHTDVFGQYTSLMQALARRAPLILVLDDLQWADTGSIGLLFHLGRRLAGSRIMIIGAYRRIDTSLDQSDGQNPLQSIVHELQRDQGDIIIDLDRTDGRRFIDAILDTEPNNLGDGFRETLYRHTAGQPLFTVELLRGLQEQGSLVKNAGRWTQLGALNWDRLPPRAEAVIAQRLSRLSPEWRAILTAASVEGEEFIVEVIAKVQGVDEEYIARGLSSALTAQNIVRASSLYRVGGRRLTRYRFGHYLVQRYLYNRLGEIERARLHEAIGNTLEALYGEPSVADAAVELAWHFESAGLPEKAVPYLLLAGERAVRLSALPEAIEHFTHGLDLLDKLPNKPERARLELALQLGLCAPLHASATSASPQHRHAALRAFTLSQQVGTTRQVIQAAYAVWSYFSNRAEHRRALESAQHLLSLAETEGDPLLAALGHAALGQTLRFLGDLSGAYFHLERVLVHADERDYQDAIPITGSNLEVACMAQCAPLLQAMGYPEQALRCCEQALDLAERLGHPFSRAEALATAAIFFAMRGDVESTRVHVESLRTLAEEKRFPLYQAWAAFVGGWCCLQRGDAQRAAADLRATSLAFDAFGCETHRPLLLQWEALASERNGDAAEGLRKLNKALAVISRTGAAFFEPEAWRLRGEMLAQGAIGDGRSGMGDGSAYDPAPGPAHNGNGADAISHEAGLPDFHQNGDGLLAFGSAIKCFRKAMAVAQAQQAKMWELRAALSLARLSAARGEGANVRQTLESIVSWFSEGYDASDLVQATELLSDHARLPVAT